MTPQTRVSEGRGFAGGLMQLRKVFYMNAPHQNEINSRRTFAIISHPDAGKTTLT